MDDNRSVKKSNVKQIIFAIIPILSFIAVTVGSTYAYYVLNVVGNDTNEEMVFETADVFAMFKGKDLIAENILPGYSGDIEFSVTNTSTEPDLYANYTLAWEIITNNVNDDNFVYTVEGTSTDKDGNTIPESDLKDELVKVSSPRKIPTVSTNIGTGLINTGVTHKYIIKVSLLENGENQNNLQDKEFEGKIVAKGDPNA